MKYEVSVKRKKTFAELTVIVFTCKTFLAFVTLNQILYLDDILMLLGIFCFLGHFFQEKVTKKRLFIIVIVVVSVFWSGYKMHSFQFIPIVFVLLLFDKMSIDEFVKITYGIKICFICIILVATFVEWMMEPADIVRTWNDGIFRVSFCKNNPNSFGVIFTWIIVDWFWLNYKKITLNDILKITLLDAVVYLLVRSETMLILHCLLFGCWLMAKKQYNNVICVIAKWSMPGLTLFTLLGAFFRYNQNVFFIWLDKYVFSGRLWFAACVAYLNKPTFWGNQFDKVFKWNATLQISRVTVDNLYIYFIYQIGIFLMLLIILAFWKLANMRNEKIAIIIIVFSFGALMEAQIMDICRAMGLALIGILFSKDKVLMDNGE